MKRVSSQKPFEDYYVYGPIFHKNEGRNMVVLIPKEKRSRLKRTSTSYARYLMSVELGRKLKKTEHVDHIDENKLNDTLGNLQILSPGENNQKSVKLRGAGRRMVKLKCPECDVKFVKPRNNSYLIIKGKLCDCCSKSCSGRFQHRKVADKKRRLIGHLIEEFRVENYGASSPPTTRE